ncbi:hypothetical protein EDC04DRAFT_2572281 [Pisolithus marmoratus]|nr:hypothetical protein EDC04DRAFT_2572281 [Pisolithus marmoratus]
MEPLTKKTRLRGPDGFEKPKSSYKPPDSITRPGLSFKSTPSVRLPQNDSNKPPSKSRSAGRPHNPFVSQSYDEAGPNKPSTFIRRPKPHSTGHRPPALGDVALKPLKVPAFTELTHAEDKATPSTSLTTLRAAFKPPSTPSEKLRSIPKPPPLPTHPEPTVPLKPLAPPPPAPSQPPPSPSKNMKTILTTSVAQAIDPTKDGTGAELLALFLQQHGHTFTSSTDQELQRGITISPRKRSHGKDPKFIRGGLAERAQRHLSSKQTDFTLWKRQIEKKLESTSTIASDMQLRILRIFEIIKTPQKAHSIPVARSGLALCRLTSRHKLADDLTAGTYVVLFSFAPTDCGSGSAISGSGELFAEGRDVDVWMPWHKVDVSSAGDTDVQRIFSQLDALNPPHILLIVSKFRVRGPKQSAMRSK